MSKLSPSTENSPEESGTGPESFNPENFKLPPRYRQEQTIPCMLFGYYSEEAKEKFAAVQAKARDWFGERSSHEDAGRLLDMSMTLYLSPEQHSELLAILDGTELEAITVQDFENAIERGVSGEAAFVDPSEHRMSMRQIDIMTNAGRAVAALAADPDMPWEQRRSLAWDVWDGMILIHDMVGSMLQNISTDIRAALISEAEKTEPKDDRGHMSSAVYSKIYEKAHELTGEYAHESEPIREAQRLSVTLAQQLLSQESPILREIVYSQFESNFHYLSRALDLFGPDPARMLVCLDDWEAFFDSQIPMLSRYFKESPLEQAQLKQAERDGVPEHARPQSKWRCSSRSQGDKEALTAFKSDETVFDELRGGHLWGVKLIGVPGPIGDRAYEVVANVLRRASAEAEVCRPAFVREKAERNEGSVPDPRTAPEGLRELYEQYAEQVRTSAGKMAGRLVHGVTDSLISGLPWCFPDKDAPLAVDPALHMERVMSILEDSLHQSRELTGLIFTAKMAAQEFAIQLSHWDYLNVLDERPEIAERAKRLFEEAQVQLPDDWCTPLRERGVLPAAAAQQ